VDVSLLITLVSDDEFVTPDEITSQGSPDVITPDTLTNIILQVLV